MFRNLLLTGAAVGSILCAGAAEADTASGGPITPFYGNIDPFYGNIDPFYGSINPFYGQINPFYGNISPFWGNIDPFWGNIDPFYGNIDPFYGNIDPFWGNISPFYGNINPFFGTIQPFWKDAGPQWGALNKSWADLQSSGATDYSQIQSQLNSLITSAANFWGAAVQKATGKDFYSGFANAMFAKYGIDPNDPNSLANVSAATRSAFFLGWYDGLMNFSGTDHADWWMGAVHWTPSITQIQGQGTNSVIGVLDSNFTSNNTGVANLKFVGGYYNFVNDHGAAVASLIAAAHDGQGAMGIAPNSTVEIYNPFDQTGTTNWSDVAQGIYTLHNKGAFVINASLGVPGWTLSSDWANILTNPSLTYSKNEIVLVKAAGNDGLAQTANVNWIGNSAPNNLIVVGSVDPTGHISSFSNTPGTACILVNNVCSQQNRLMYDFIVAPGELILVSDNHGGVTRMSGTSFAAPLVTGAVALLQDRWPWLQQNADATVQIILQSARDLGAPGVDPVYGWGELDVAASQSPLNFDNLYVYKPYYYGYDNGNVNTFLGVPWSTGSLKNSVLNPGQLSLWQQQRAYLVAFENVGSTFRDFQIPLSSLLIGKNAKVNGNSNPFQSYIYQRLIDWANGPKTAQFNSQTMPLSDGSWSLGMTATQSTPDEVNAGQGPFHAEFVATNASAGLTLRLGEGNGAHSIAGAAGFDMRSDFDPSTGGVNPVLGFASGGAYASGAMAIGKDVKVNFGFTQKADDHLYMDPTFGPIKAVPLATSRASASTLGLEYAVARGVSLNANYTTLQEGDELLGAQGSGLLTLPNGAQTHATTVGASAMLGDGWRLAGSATSAHTTVPANSQLTLLTLTKSGLDSTAYELVAEKTGLFDDKDLFRVSLTQPLHVESGALQYSSLQVVDRKTGALGQVSQSWNVSGVREYRLEATYGVPLLDGRAELDQFALLDMNSPVEAKRGLSVSFGMQFRMGL